MRCCENENLCLVVGYDSIAHHSVWGSTNRNIRGDVLLEFLNSSNLEILNRVNRPTFYSDGSLVLFDITLGSLRLLESITGWGLHHSPPCQIVDIFRSFYVALLWC